MNGTFVIKSYHILNNINYHIIPFVKYINKYSIYIFNLKTDILLIVLYMTYIGI